MVDIMYPREDFVTHLMYIQPSGHISSLGWWVPGLDAIQRTNSCHDSPSLDPRHGVSATNHHNVQSVLDCYAAMMRLVLPLAWLRRGYITFINQLALIITRVCCYPCLIVLPLIYPGPSWPSSGVVPRLLLFSGSQIITIEGWLKYILRKLRRWPSLQGRAPEHYRGSRPSSDD